MPKKQLSIYFGLGEINLIESSGGRIINQVVIPLVSEQDKDIKVAYPEIPLEEVKIVALIQEAIRKSRIEATEVALSLSLNTLLIRFFEMPHLPQAELRNAVSFEAKKYMPFRLEELLFDFYSRPLERNKNKLQIIFVAAKKETVQSFISILSQCGLNTVSIEPGTFSVLRALRYFKKIEPKSSFAILDVTSQEANFTIIDKGFVILSRELKLEGKSEDLFFKLVNEARVSLDYYRRHFSAKNIEKMVLFSDGKFLDQIDNLSKEVGISSTAIDFKGSDMAKSISSLGLVKAFGASLASVLPYPFKLNIIEKKALPKEEQITTELPAAFAFPFSLKRLRNSLLIGLGIIIFAYLLSLPLGLGIKEKLRQLETQVSKETDIKFTTPEDLEKTESEQLSRLGTIKNVVATRKYISPKLNSLVKLLPNGLWLNRLSVANESGRLKVSLSGSVYVEDEQKGFSVVDQFVSKLKSDKEFSADIGQINLVSVRKERAREPGLTITAFEIFSK